MVKNLKRLKKQTEREQGKAEGLRYYSLLSVRIGNTFLRMHTPRMLILHDEVYIVTFFCSFEFFPTTYELPVRSILVTFLNLLFRH